MPLPPWPKKDNAQSTLYKAFSNDFTFEYMPGVILVPRATQPPLAIRVHKPYTIKRQRFSAAKERTPPVVPGPNPNDELLALSVNMPSPKPGSTNPPSFNFSVSGEYVYLDSKTSHPASGFSTPLDPYPFEFPEIKKLQKRIPDIDKLKPAFYEGNYLWPVPKVSPEFFDPTLSMETLQ